MSKSARKQAERPATDAAGYAVDQPKIKVVVGTPAESGEIAVDDMVTLERKDADGNVHTWRSRPGVETPIPDDFVPVLKQSGAIWRYADGSRLHADDAARTEA